MDTLLFPWYYGFVREKIYRELDDVTESEKRALALQIMAQEQQRLSKVSTILDENKALLREVVQRATRNQELFDSLAQQGITWKQLKAAYDEGFQRGRSEMLDYNLAFFYAAAAIVHHEVFDSSPHEILAFIGSLPNALNGETEIELILERCLKETGVEISGFDKPRAQVTGKREAVKALERMKKTGITLKDVEYERQVGYDHGWNSPFHLSACYAAAALALHRQHGCGTGKIESFLDRMAEICDEEISAADILERCRREAGVDVNDLAVAP